MTAINQIDLLPQAFTASKGTVNSKTRNLVNVLNEGNPNHVMNYVADLHRKAVNAQINPKVDSDSQIKERNEALRKYLGTIVTNSDSKKEGLVTGANFNTDRGNGKAFLHIDVIILDKENGFRESTWAPSKIQSVNRSVSEYFMYNFNLRF